MKATRSSPHGDLRLRVWLMTSSTTGGGRLFRGPRAGTSTGPEGAQLSSALADAPSGDPLQRLGGGLPAHLGVATLPLDELDRHLDHAQSSLDRPEGEVGLEDVAGGLHVVEP